jgi:kynureninase
MSTIDFDYLRSLFHLPDNTVYLDGNSLGALPYTAKTRLSEVIAEEWADDLVSGWNTKQWIDLPLSVGEQIAPIIGANQGTVICCDSLSINLFKALVACLEINAVRNLIVLEKGQFPTDSYIADGLSRLLGADRCQTQSVDISALTPDALSHSAVLLLSHVDYKSGSLRDMGTITKMAQSAGCLVIWDLAHSAGVIDMDLEASQVDFAVGCTYKFLNGGPGAPGFLYAAERHQEAQNPLPGWMGHARLFDFEAEYEAARGIKRFLTGTQSVLALSAVRASLSLFDGLAMRDVRTQSLALTRHFMTLWQQSTALQTHSVLVTPTDDAQRGSQVSLALDSAFPVSQALIADGVIVDFREPNIVRFGFSPLYNTFCDAERAIKALEIVLVSERYRLPEFQIRSTVT